MTDVLCHAPETARRLARLEAAAREVCQDIEAQYADYPATILTDAPLDAMPRSRRNAIGAYRCIRAALGDCG